jgi:cysteine desulfurase family protein (TIGR01976 family)
MSKDNDKLSNRIASVDDIRSHFPALQRFHNGHPVAYFDGPGGTQVPTQIVEAMSDYLFNHNANTHWEYPTSNETDRMIDDSRAAFADFFNCSPAEVIFGQNMTTLTMHLSRALGRRFNPGDEIIVTELDHHANSDPWRELARDRDLTIRTLPMNIESGQLEIDELAGLINERTKLVAIGAASNILGTINDLETIVSTARDAGALTFVDAVHYAAHELIDIEKIGCDFLAVSAYKFYGPHIGIMYGRKNLLDELDTPKLRPAPNNSPDRFETGTQNHEGIAGGAAAVNFMAGLSNETGTRREKLQSMFAEQHRRQLEMFTLLWNGLSKIDGVVVYGPSPEEPRTSTLSFSIDGIDSDAAARRLAGKGLFLSDGDFYAMSVVEKLGLKGLVRAGLACYSTVEEIERLIDEVSTIRDLTVAPR